MNAIKTLLVKDLKIDFRQKYAIAGIGLYVLATIYIAYLAFNQIINLSTWNALFWIILLFASITGMMKSFGSEANRAHYLYFVAKPGTILVAKLIYNLIYELLLVAVCFGTFSVLFGNSPANGPFFINLGIGAVGMAVAFTLTSSLSSKTQNSSNMMAILSFPIIVPILVLSVSNSRKIIQGAQLEEVSGSLATLVSVIVIIIALSFILFPYSWKN